MKNILPIITCLFALSTYAQQGNPKPNNHTNNPCDLNTSTSKEFDEIVLQSDTSLTKDSIDWPTDPTPYPAHNKANKDTRLIYFVHGLGGDDKSWDAVDDAHMDDYIYTPLRVDYATHQRDFKEASFEVYNEMNKLRLSALYNNQKNLTTDKPYAIGHSQGGLVLRDMDRKYSTNYDAHFQNNTRQFHGIVTFCTPHLGDKIAVSQTELSKLSADFSYIIGNAVLKKQVAKFSLKVPFFAKSLQKLSTSGSILLQSLSNNLIVEGINTMSKGQQAPMTQQYGPHAPYVTQTMNYSNATIPKALFYAEESDPLLFKIATYMVGPSASDFVHYPRFGANDDQQIEKGVNELRAKLLADINSHKREAEKIKKKIDRTNIPIVGLAYLLTKKNKLRQLHLQEQAIKAESDAVDFIEKVNTMYKTIIGAVDIRRLFQREIAGYWCVTGQKTITKTLPYTGKTTFTVDIKHKVDDAALCEGKHTIPIYRSVAVEQPTDAVLSVKSQKGFPGCPERYKLLLNEVRVYDNNDQFVGIRKESDVNHIQILNCWQTDEALRRIYEGRGVPVFFKLREKK